MRHKRYDWGMYSKAVVELIEKERQSEFDSTCSMLRGMGVKFNGKELSRIRRQWKDAQKSNVSDQNDEDETYYCEKCHGCGYIGCDGVESFLKNHVSSNTDCKHEEQFIDEIIEHFEALDKYYEPSPYEAEEALLELLNKAYAAGREGRDFDVDDQKKDHFIRFVTGQYIKPTDGSSPW